MVNRGVVALGAGFLGLAALSCDEITTTESTAELRLELSVTSELLAESGDTLVGDRVRFATDVTLEGESVLPEDVRFASSDSTVVRILDDRAGDALLAGTGVASVTATLSLPELGGQPLTASLPVPVDSFSVEVSVRSLATGAVGLAVAPDTVRFEARVTRVDGREVPVEGLRFTSSDSSVVTILEPTTGLAVLRRAGLATVTASFDRPRVPGGDLVTEQAFDVDEFALELAVASIASGRVQAGDTLVSDSVLFTLTARLDGEVVPVSGQAYESSDPTVVQLLDPGSGRAVLAGSGTASVRVTFQEPELPRREATLPLRVGTFRVAIDGPTAPVMGDTVAYTAVVVDTRTGEPVATAGRTVTSSDLATVEILDPTVATAFVRDLGSAEIRFGYGQPTLPHAPVEGTLALEVTQERFYGSPSDVDGDFGDRVVLAASPVHRFTDATRVEFSNGAAGFVETVEPDRLEFRVGAGASSGRLALLDLVDESGDPRDRVLTSWEFDAAGTIEDRFEPNDRLPLEDDDGDDRRDLEIEPRFNELLSLDPTRAAPPDTDFFYLDIRRTSVLDLRAEWQQDADLDFKVCLGQGRPPQDYVRFLGEPICQRGPEDNSTDRSREEAVDLVLARGVYIVAFYCIDCPDVPVTYLVRVD